ncbi:MAG: putative Sulfate-transporting ATPase [Frankiales bacterium]|nr:putative Sulfate-transporting ATPase [Frankiales bacterium]
MSVDVGLALVTGLATGSVYAVAGLGLALTYKTSGIFNIGYGAVAAGGALVMYTLWVDLGLPWPLAALVAGLGYGVVAGLLVERLSAALAKTPTTSRIVGTVGLVLLVQGVTTLAYGDAALPYPDFLPLDSVAVLGARVSVKQIVIVLVGIAAAGGLLALLRYTRTGTAMQAVVDDPDLLDMAGTDPLRVRRTASVIGGVLAALSGILIAPALGLDAILLVLLVVQAFGAVALGRFTDLGLTYLGGLVVGVAQAVLGQLVVGSPSLSSLPSSTPFLILFGVLLLSRPGRLKELGTPVRPVPLNSSRLTGPARLATNGTGLVLLLLVPFLVGGRLVVFSNALAYVVLFLSLALLVNFSGQVSLCQVGFAAVGAAAFATFTTERGLPWLVALLLAGLAVVPVGALIAIPAIRLAGLFLALATLGFGILLAQVGYGLPVLFGGAKNGSVSAPRPDLFSGDRAYYYVLVAAALAVSALVVGIDRSRLGRLLRAMGDAPTALSTAGLQVKVTQVLVFCLSAFLAGISGALLVPVTGFASQNSFSFFNSLIVLALLTICGRRTVPSAFAAAALLAVLPSYLDSEVLLRLQPVVFGALATAVAVATGVRGSTGRLDAAAERARTTRSLSPVDSRVRPLVLEST